ncbi:sodium channel subunit beta-2 [Erpetoichthys calabaricus]|uniref:Sodium channel, voltage-gated, type II, beta n=1 Tax=Erpetoichthys calabaricus TaxID=27687 RepID=A0A8C4XB88_ERPCA|nr:sodium channel subunit beta-2 [Erpetoichthys calabaricus]
MYLSLQKRSRLWMKISEACVLGFAMLLVMGHLASAMDVTVLSKMNALNGTNVRLSCTFNSCYKIENSKFSMNWTYKECHNCTNVTFLQYKHKWIYPKDHQFEGRVNFTGNLNKNDVSVTIKNIQIDDSGLFTCEVKNPPDRQQGRGVIDFNVITEVPPERDSTIAVIIGASVGGFLAVLILILVVVKCVRRRKKQELISDEQKIEEEGKMDGEGGTEEGTKCQ